MQIIFVALRTTMHTALKFESSGRLLGWRHVLVRFNCLFVHKHFVFICSQIFRDFSLIGSADFFGLNQYTTRLTRPKERQSDEKPEPFETIPDADVDEISGHKWDMYVWCSDAIIY